MHPIRSFTFSCLALIVLVGLSGQAFATTVIVGTCKTGVHFSTIGAAVTAAPVGATIDVCPGTYPEQVAISKNLTLIGIASGTSDAAVVVTPATGLVQNGLDIYGNPVAAQIFVQGGADVTISHLTVDGSNNQLSGCGAPDPIGIYYQNSSGKITDNAVRDVLMDPADQGCQLGLAINVESNTGTPAVTISDNSVRNYDKNGITVSGPATGAPGPDATVSANTVIGLGATSVIAQNGIQRFWRDGISHEQLCGGRHLHRSDLWLVRHSDLRLGRHHRYQQYGGEYAACNCPRDGPNLLRNWRRDGH